MTAEQNQRIKDAFESVLDSTPPSTRVPQLRGDLDNIVLLALRKEPSQRY